MLVCFFCGFVFYASSVRPSVRPSVRSVSRSVGQSVFLVVVCACVRAFVAFALSFIALVVFYLSVDLRVLSLLCVFMCVYCSQPMEDGKQGFMACVTAPGVTEVRLTGKNKLLVC